MPTELEIPEGLVQIRVPLEREDEEPGPDTDVIWAESLGHDRFRIESCPFFAYGVSREDVVRVSGRSPDGAPEVEDVLAKSGHRTLRVALAPETELRDSKVRELLARLVELGCTHESLPPKIVAVDVPPAVDLGGVVATLEALARQRRLLWEWADPRPC
jgi:hypothetical protein